MIARAASIYGVDVIEVFSHPGGRGESREIRKVLEYMEAPQYLRKRLFPLDEALKYAGILPPLRIPSHKPRVPFEKIRKGEVREGVTNGDGTVDIGLDVAPSLSPRSAAGRRVTIRIASVTPPTAETIQRGDAPGYWGYVVETKTLPEVLSDTRFRVKIATSRLGTPLAESLPGLRERVRVAEGVKLIFGSPSRGLRDLAGRELDSRVDFVLNLFPQQHVETVRTEEAVFACLELLALLSAEKA